MNPADKSDSTVLVHRQWLETHLKSRVFLTWTDNRTSMVSVSRHPATGYQLRLHHMFQVAPEGVWYTLVQYILNKNHTAKEALRTYINQRQDLIRQAPSSHRTPSVCRPQGNYVDLDAIYHHLNQQYFHNRVQTSITWMRMTIQRKRTSIRFGVYDRQQNLIRIHRLLDQPFVPHYFVESVVYHEMLHHLIPAVRIRGKWYNHPPAFKRAERQYPHYQKAQDWERKNLHRLLA